MPTSDGWNEYRKLFTDFIQETRRDHALLLTDMAALRHTVATLKTNVAVNAIKSSCFGTLGGFLAIGLFLLLKNVL